MDVSRKVLKCTEKGTVLDTFQRIFEELGKNVTATVTAPITAYVNVSFNRDPKEEIKVRWKNNCKICKTTETRGETNYSQGVNFGNDIDNELLLDLQEKESC